MTPVSHFQFLDHIDDAENIDEGLQDSPQMNQKESYKYPTLYIEETKINLQV